MDAPKIYYEWVQVLNSIKEGINDKEALELMKRGQRFTGYARKVKLELLS